MCIAKIQIISRVIIYLLPSIQQVKTVLVGQRMTSRAERTRTESETEIISVDARLLCITTSPMSLYHFSFGAEAGKSVAYAAGFTMRYKRSSTSCTTSF